MTGKSILLFAGSIQEDEKKDLEKQHHPKDPGARLLVLIYPRSSQITSISEQRHALRSGIGRDKLVGPCSWALEAHANSISVETNFWLLLQ